MSFVLKSVGLTFNMYYYDASKKDESIASDVWRPLL